MSKIPFVFYGTDSVAQMALDALREHDLVPSKNAEVAILVSYGKILTQEEIDSYRYGVINIHPSLLPKLRGPSPIKTAILDDLGKTGVSIMRIDEEIDHGPLLAKAEIDLSPRIATADELCLALIKQGVELLADVLPKYLVGNLELKEQDHSLATYTRKFNPEDGLIEYPFTRGHEIDRKVRALNPEPSTYTLLSTNRGKKRVKILSGQVLEDMYEPNLVQPAGKRPMTWSSFKNGYKFIDPT
ncbi:MAG TPA: formyltransferase family protein [Candidatus Paceibacterota bacterium]